MNPKYPVFIPTKGRWKHPYTIKAMERIGVPFKIVVEPQEFDDYARVVKPKDILVLPHSNNGLVITRNWIWDYAQSLGVKRFWTFDDNIIEFYRLNNNIKFRMKTGTFLSVIEDFVERFKNVPIAGMNYEMFAPRKRKHPPLILNTRIYSNMIIQTNAISSNGKPYRNEGFYNDDTDLCLRVLKDGFCTIQFNVFLANKIATMKIGGGMTPHYQGDGRYKMALELQQKHPDVTKITYKWGRWQHVVDYKRFKANRLVLKDDIIIPDGPNEYGMKLVKKGNNDEQKANNRKCAGRRRAPVLDA